MSSRTFPLGPKLPFVQPSAALQGPDWVQASAPRIRRALRHALAKPCGGWYAVACSSSITEKPVRVTVRDRHFVAYRADGELRIGYDECPHLGASLSTGHVCKGSIVCPWHGLALGQKPHAGWHLLPSYDDGVLAWLRLDAFFKADQLTDRPQLPRRPAHYIAGVVSMEAACEPRDVLANRLDPWHGAHFHPQAFAKLRVTDASDEQLTVRVQFRMLGPLVFEVDASFHCPDPRSIVMTIINGEGEGSVVETHATPLAEGRSLVLEATLASSPRPGFRHALLLKRAIAPLIEHVARGLWVDDLAYAERLYALRSGAISTSLPVAVPSQLEGVSGHQKSLPQVR